MMKKTISLKNIFSFFKKSYNPRYQLELVDKKGKKINFFIYLNVMEAMNVLN